MKTMIVLLILATAATEVDNWDLPRQLSFTPLPSELRYNWGFAVSVDGAGVVHAAWLDLHDARDRGRVFYARSGDDGAVWLPPLPLSGDDAAHPKIASSGPHVWVGWHVWPSGPIVVRHSPDHGETWRAPVGITPAGGYPSIAAWGDAVHLVWSAPDAATGAPEIFLRSSPDAGESWTPARRVSTSDDRSSWVPSIAVWGRTVHVAWSDERHNVDERGEPADCRFGKVPCREEEYYRRSDDLGESFGVETRLTHDPPGMPEPSWAPSIAVSGPNVHVAFFDARTGSFHIYYTRSLANGTPGSFEPERILSDARQVQNARPVVAVRGHDVGVVYFGVGPVSLGPPSAVYFVGSPDGGDRFAPPTLLAPNGLHPSLAVSPAGTTHVVYHAPASGGVSQIFHRRRK
jgi:hypothetical protein